MPKNDDEKWSRIFIFWNSFMRKPFSIKWICLIEKRSFNQKYKFSNKNKVEILWKVVKFYNLSDPTYPPLRKLHGHSVSNQTNGRNQWCIKYIPKKCSLGHCKGNCKLDLFELLHNTLGKLQELCESISVLSAK